jgi:hypothetical protein
LLFRTAAKTTGGEGGRARVGPLYALLFFFYTIRVRVPVGISFRFEIGVYFLLSFAILYPDLDLELD